MVGGMEEYGVSSYGHREDMDDVYRWFKATWRNIFSKKAFGCVQWHGGQRKRQILTCEVLNTTSCRNYKVQWHLNIVPGRGSLEKISLYFGQWSRRCPREGQGRCQDTAASSKALPLLRKFIDKTSKWSNVRHLHLSCYKLPSCDTYPSLTFLTGNDLFTTANTKGDELWCAYILD
jgi:hypothetical protein